MCVLTSTSVVLWGSCDCMRVAGPGATWRVLRALPLVVSLCFLVCFLLRDKCLEMTSPQKPFDCLRVPPLCSDRLRVLLVPSQSCDSAPTWTRWPSVGPSSPPHPHLRGPSLLTGAIPCSQVLCHPLSGSFLEGHLGGPTSRPSMSGHAFTHPTPTYD